MKISEEAVDAALDVLFDHGHNGIECRPQPGLDSTVRAALEAAAPHLRIERAKACSHQCEEGLGTWVGQCILPLDHNPIVPGLGHINGRGELFVGTGDREHWSEQGL